MAPFDRRENLQLLQNQRVDDYGGDIVDDGAISQAKVFELEELAWQDRLQIFHPAIPS